MTEQSVQKDRMRIGITSFATAGGSGIMATELGLHLAKRGHEIHFISSAPPMRMPAFEPNVLFHQVETSTYPPFPAAPYSLALATKMTEVARSHSLDILHVHYAIPHAASAYLAKQMLAPIGIATLTTLHGTDITLVGREPSFFPLTRFVIEQSDGVTAVSQWLLDETRKTFQVDTPIEVVPNFVDTSVFVPRLATRRNNSLSRDGEPLLLHASNFRPVKNVHRVVEVFAAARSESPCRLVMVGDGPERGPAERLARRLGVADDIIFLGSQESMEELMAMADVLLLPSQHESFGLVALEAMSCETPVVGSRNSGLAEVLEHGVTGFLRDPDDVPGMTQDVLRLLREPELAARIGGAGRSVARELYCIQCVIERYLSIYRSLLGVKAAAEG